MLGKPRKGKSDTNLRTQSHMRDVSRYSISIGTKLGRRRLWGRRTRVFRVDLSLLRFRIRVIVMISFPSIVSIFH